MTYMEQFEAIKKKALKLDTSSLPHDFAMQVNLTDEDCGGIFYISNIGGDFKVEPYDYYDHTVMITVNSKDFIKILQGKLDATDAYFRGLLILEGNIDHAQAIANLAKKSTEKKPAAKKTSTKTATKTATKKATEKKPAAKKTAAKKTTTKKTAAK